MSERPRLDSWKEIAAYLGRDVRTVIRWEQQRGLPVSRVPGGKLARVFAYTDELDQWLAQGAADGVASDVEVGDSDAPRNNGEQTTALRTWARPIATVPLILLLAAAVIGVAGWALTRASAVPQRVGIVGNALLALDASGRTVWTHSFKPGDVVPAPGHWNEITDLDGDGRDEVIALVEVTRPPVSQHQGELLRFSSDGKRQWSFAATDRLRFGDGEYGPPWAAEALALYHAGAEVRVAIAVHHFTWWPGLLISLNARGERQGLFVNSGWIQSVRPSHDGRHLLVSGVTNNARAYFFAVLDAEHPSGRSPEPPGSGFECLTCPQGDPLQYFVLPRSDVSREQPFPADGPALQTFEDGTVQVQTFESGGPNIAATIYEFAPDFSIRRARFSESFWEWHRQLEESGKVRHGRDDGPERRDLEVRSWTRTAGWQTLQVQVR